MSIIETTYDPSKTKTLGLRALREDTDSVISAVSGGSNFVITRKSKALFRIVPMLEEVWETSIDFTDGGKTRGILAEELLDEIEKFRLKNPSHGR
jgi:antitoxin (DNA-binding transcriptional repressor) of toxin-antitoxin stability system